MENNLSCNYLNCGSRVNVACNCSTNPILLCEGHIRMHIQELPDKSHTLQKPYLPLQPHEQEAFFAALTFITDTERSQNGKLMTEHSRRAGNILKELEDTKTRLLQQLRILNHAHLNSLDELTKYMAEMKITLLEMGRLGIPTFRGDGFSARLKTLKENNQVFVRHDILMEIKAYWGALGMSSFVKAQEQQTLQSIQITDQVQLKQIREHQLRTEHRSNISFSPDGCYYAAGAADKTIKIWNAENGQLAHSLAGHNSAVLAVSFSPDSESLVSGSKDNIVRLWNVPSGQLTKQLKKHSNSVFSVVFSNNGEFIASGSQDKTIRLWTAKGDPLQLLKGHSSTVSSVSFSDDSRLLASGSEDKTIKIWDVYSAELKKTLSSHLGGVFSVCFAKNSGFLISGSRDTTVKLWKVEAGEVIHTFNGHSGFVKSVAFSRDDYFIASGSRDETVKLWKVATKSLITTLSQHSSPVLSVKFSPNGLVLASRDATKLTLVKLA